MDCFQRGLRVACDPQTRISSLTVRRHRPALRCGRAGELAGSSAAGLLHAAGETQLRDALTPLTAGQLAALLSLVAAASVRVAAMASARDIPQVALAFDCSVALDRREALLALARERGIVAAGDTGEPPTHVLAERGDWATLAARNAADIARGAKLVLPSWLEAVCKLSILPDSRMHSPDATKVFAGTVICTTGVRLRCRGASDTTQLSADQDRLVQLILLEFGGAHRTSLTREVTHLLATTAKSDKYYRAVKYGATVGISIVRPHWSVFPCAAAS